MKRSNSIDASNNAKPGGSSGPFAYQTRLLERTSSRGSGSSLSRSNSQTAMGFITTSTDSLSLSPASRRWTPSHRVTNSVDAVRGKWEERSREAAAEEIVQTPLSPLKGSSRTPINLLSYTESTPKVSLYDQSPRPRPGLDFKNDGIPTFMKRGMMPAPIVASPLSPNSTGILVEADSPLSATPNRIRLPSSNSSISHPLNSSSPDVQGSHYLTFTTRPQRSHTFDESSQSTRWSESSNLEYVPPIPDPASIITTPRRRPSSIHGISSLKSKFDSATVSPLSGPRFSGASPISPDKPSLSFSAPQVQVSSQNPMTPTPYRSSYMSNKKSSAYGNDLGVSRRKLGRHLPRIASGDGDEKWDENMKDSRESSGRELRDRSNIVQTASEYNPTKQEFGLSNVPGVEDVAGLPGRIQLKAPNSPSPIPSARFGYGLWADKQRHLIHAYEYLCHVGEAQQWIEGCLGEELGFGVVEMEEGLRNGVVLAKLVRAFQGETAVRKIYEAPKLDFRHSDNVNYFFNFVRQIGLPEGFIFELTDLYEKKNLPKVIYCIHALSHLLARRGIAERIGNLLGHLQFSDDQLQQTQKGLKEAGVVMPNFGNVGRELAKEINEEPEVEVETEQERCDRLLLENEASVIGLQARARGFLRRSSHTGFRGRIRIAERHVTKLQSKFRGHLVRRRMLEEREHWISVTPWIVLLQAAARASLFRKIWLTRLRRIRKSASYITKVQAQLRGVLQRRRFGQLKAALRKIHFPITRMQAVARAHVTRHARVELTKTFHKPSVTFSVVAFQAIARGLIARKVEFRRADDLKRCNSSIIALQARSRGVIMRRRMRTQMAKIENLTNVIIQIQAAVRTYLARKRLLVLIRGLRRATPMVLALQARARASLACQHHQSINKALAEVQNMGYISALQAMARAALARLHHQEINKHLEIVAPDITRFQAAVRGVLLRWDFRGWRDHLYRSQPVVVLLQAMLRGAFFRRSFQAKMQYYRANLTKVVKIQSLFRAKETREQYRQLTLGKNVTVGTIKNFVHLLDDSEADFQEEIKVERLRKRVVEHIRENQVLESDVNDLDVKIALVVQNVKSFEEVMKARKRHGADSAVAHAARVSLLAAHGDPFSGPNTLDQEARRKLELYQQLFYLVQTKGEYLSRLFIHLSTDKTPESNRRFTERVVLTLFGYGQDRREDFLLLKLFQLAIREEIDSSSSIEEIVSGHPLYINIAVHYVRPKQVTYARDAFQTVIREVIDSDDLDLEVDPSIVHRSRIDMEEMRSGTPSSQTKDVSFREALKDPDTRAIYIRHLQILQWWTEAFVTAITQSTKKLPYGVRYLARETLLALRSRYPDAPDGVYAACVGRLIYYRYINPAIITPETFDIVSKTVDIAARKNLAQISKVLTQIASGSDFGDESPSYVPINDYVRKAIATMTSWFLEVANVPDAETQFHAHEFLDATVQPKPIYISPNEIYTIHGLLSKNQEFLAPQSDDTLRLILIELGGVPNLGNEELKDARDKMITLQLTNRFAYVQDPQAEEKTLWVQAKRGVLAILRVQPAQDLLESLMRPVTENDELVWEDILEDELEIERRQLPRRQPSAAANDSTYRLEDIRSLKFAAVKALAISNLLALEKQNRISREDGFQGILNAIAGDVRSKHRKRLQRQQEMENMNEALRQLAERKKYFEEQIDSYHSYVDTAMNTMQRGKGKKRFVLPFTKQYFHLRDLQRSGESPQFGSFLYTAKDLYDKGILLSIDQYSPRQFDKLQLTLSSRKAGVFTLLLETTLMGVLSRIASEDIRMEDLLQAKYEKRSSLSLLNNRVKVNFELFLYQINKKFYV